MNHGGTEAQRAEKMGWKEGKGIADWWSERRSQRWVCLSPSRQAPASERDRCLGRVLCLEPSLRSVPLCLCGECLAPKPPERTQAVQQ